MLVEEYQVTFRTRGQYPAAPPQKLLNHPIAGGFCVSRNKKEAPEGASLV